MTTISDKSPLDKLREEFPPGTVGKLPKGGVQLDYVGHAAVTDRLLTVDPMWNWEPLALDENGLPQYDNKGGLWIKLTVCGVTRLGYGDGPDPKQRIGDALRNAAMRFGVALSLWSKDELESGYSESKPTANGNGHSNGNGTAAQTNRRAQGTVRSAPNRPQADPATGEVVDPNAASPAQLGKIHALFGEKAFPDDKVIRHNYVAAIIGREFVSTKELTKREASAVIEALIAEAVDVPSQDDDEEPPF